MLCSCSGFLCFTPQTCGEQKCTEASFHCKTADAWHGICAPLQHKFNNEIILGKSSARMKSDGVLRKNKDRSFWTGIPYASPAQFFICFIAVPLVLEQLSECMSQSTIWSMPDVPSPHILCAAFLYAQRWCLENMWSSSAALISSSMHPYKLVHIISQLKDNVQPLTVSLQRSRNACNTMKSTRNTSCHGGNGVSVAAN